jgi:hypothetical protein
VNSKLLITSLAIGAIAAGGATAKVRHHNRMAHDSAGFTYAAPAQPIPYAEMDHYLHASRAERKSMEMAAANGGASTGSTANTSATTSDSSAPASDSSQMSAPASPSAPAAAPPETAAPSTSAPGPVNPPTTAPDNSSATPPATTPPPSSPQPN